MKPAAHLPPDADPDGSSVHAHPILVAVSAGALALTAALGVAAFGGRHVRGSAMLLTPAPAAESALEYTDAPESATFFDARDSVTVRVPWDMTLAELLALYHLENNADARAALARELGAVDADHPLREGQQVTFRLTATRGNP